MPRRRGRRAKRGTIVDLIAGYGAIVGGFGIAFALSSIGGTPDQGTVFGLVGLAVSAAQLVVSYGFYRRQDWAWEYGVIVYGLIATLKLAQYMAAPTMAATGPFDLSVFLYLFLNRRPGRGWRHGFTTR